MTPGATGNGAGETTRVERATRRAVLETRDIADSPGTEERQAATP